MDKGKRTDLLAAGRKKLQQYRQKKDHKGVSKDGKSSSKGGKQQKGAADAEETTTIPDPEPSASAAHTDSSDLPAGVEHVDTQAVDHNKSDEVPAEHSSNVEGSQLVANEVNNTEVKAPELVHCDGETCEAMISSAGISESDDVDRSIVSLPPNADEVEVEAVTGHKVSSGTETAEESVEVPIPANEKDVGVSTVSLGKYSDIRFSDVKIGQEDTETEKGGVQGPEFEMHQEIIPAKYGFSMPEEIIPESHTFIYSMQEEVPDEFMPDNSTSINHRSEMLSSDEITVHNSAPLEQEFYASSSYQVISDNPDFNQSLAATQAASFESNPTRENLEEPLTNEITCENITPIVEIFSVSSLLPVASNLTEEKCLEIADAGTKGSTDKGIYSEQTFSGEVVHLQRTSDGELPDSALSTSMKEDEPHPTAELFVSGSSSTLSDVAKGIFIENNLTNEYESIKRHLYLTSFERDFLQVQQDVENEISMEFNKQSSYELCKLRALLKESQESNAAINMELAHCRSQLEAATTEKEKLGIQLLSKNEEIEILSNKVLMLQNKMEYSKEELVSLSADLASCSIFIENLQKETSNLNANLSMETDMRKKLEDEKEFLANANAKLSSELLEQNANLSMETDMRKKLEDEKDFLANLNAKLASELLEQKERLLSALDKQSQLECNLRESGTYFEQLAEETLYLSSSLDIHKHKIKELEDQNADLSFCSQKPEPQINHLGNQLDRNVSAKGPESGSGNLVLVSHSDDLSPENFDRESCSSVLVVLKGHLKEAKSMLQNLEGLVQVMHSQSLLAKSGGRTTTSGVSKLIQAFESKTNAADNTYQETQLTDGVQSDDSYKATQEKTNILRDTLEQMDLTVGQIEGLLFEELSCKRFTRKLEVDQAQNNKIDILQAKIDELTPNFFEYIYRIDYLQNLFDEMQQHTHEEAAGIISRLELLKNEVNDTGSMMRQEWESIMNSILGAIRKLDQYTGLQISGDMDGHVHVQVSVDSAIKEFDNLNAKLDVAVISQKTFQSSYIELNDLYTGLRGSYELAVDHVHKTYVVVEEFLHESFQSYGEPHLDVKAEECMQLLPEKCEMLIVHLQKSLADQHVLISEKKELELRLSSQNEEIEELNERFNCLMKESEDLQCAKDELALILKNKSDVLEEINTRCTALIRVLDYHDFKDPDVASALAGNDELSLMSNRMDGYFLKSLLPQLEESFSLHIEKYNDMIEQVDLSKDCLLKANMFPRKSYSKLSFPLSTLLREEFVPKVSELMDQLNISIALNIKHEAELQILMDYSMRLVEALEVSRSELRLKNSELEQSEQRFSSVREKLSIAVAKGKGLITQRDSLKQSLMEKTSELEKCSQELYSKELLLKEMEVKLKSYSEVDRIEALESELSYIRNSATALRDSFLLKDSILQRIEEVLEDLDFPENFHSKDIVEKIETMSRMVVGNRSFPTSDWEHKGSGGGSHSDGASLVIDTWRDDSQASYSGYDELKIKYEDLERKFYGLAEHNDMLEQSLVERNGLVRRWEEVLDGIHFPPHLRTLDPVDKIACLGSIISEIMQEKDALQLKIENLEASSGMLKVDLEDSHKRISKLSSEILDLRFEKDSLSETLDKLNLEYLGISEKVVRVDVLQRELADLQEKFSQKVHELSGMEVGIDRLQDLVRSGFIETDSSAPSEGSPITCLEVILKKLLDEYTALISEKSVVTHSQDNLESEERNMSPDPIDITNSKEQEVINLRLELENVCSNMDFVKQERDELMEKFQSLVSEIEGLKKQQEILQQERIAEMEKNQELSSKIEALRNEKDALQEKLSDEEQKTASIREKLNVAVRKGKGLVQQRDSLKQTIEEMNSVMEKLKSETSQQIEAMKSEKSLLIDQLTQTEESLHKNRHTLSRLLNVLDDVDVGGEIKTIDPVQKLEEIAKLNRDLCSALDSSQQEAKKSKRAAELLLSELNEVQERADVLQEELANAEAAALQLSKQKDIAESAKDEAVYNLEQLTLGHSEERRKHFKNITELRSGIDQLREVCFELSGLLNSAFTKDVDIFHHLETFLESIDRQQIYNPHDFPSTRPLGQESFQGINPVSTPKLQEQPSEFSIVGHLAFVNHLVYECLRGHGDLRNNILEQSFLVDQHAARLWKFMESTGKKLAYQNEENALLKRNLSLLHETCIVSVAELENVDPQIAVSIREHLLPKASFSSKFPSQVDKREPLDDNAPLVADESIRSLSDKLLSAVKVAKANDKAENNLNELKDNVSQLQRELQEKDVQMNTVYTELVSQIRDAKALAMNYSSNLDSTEATMKNLEKKIELIENDNKVLRLRVQDLENFETSSNELQGRVKSLNEALTAKDQEIEALMQALDEEEGQMEYLENRNKELENIIQEKNLTLENLEASRAKSLTKFSTTVNKFDELHNLSESLLAEVENLQTQLQEQESEISFLRQEVTRCTNELLSSQEVTKQYSSETQELIKWLDMMVSRLGLINVDPTDDEWTQIHSYTKILEENVTLVVDELDELHNSVQNKDALLQSERMRVEELLRKSEDLEVSLMAKENQIELLQEGRNSSQQANRSFGGPKEAEQVKSKSVSGSLAMYARSGRKVNDDQIAIAVDTEKDDIILDDEDDDKAHGFKSLTMSRFIPRVTRPVADKIDGIWVSGERLLMRQPTLRLGFLIYWIALHALLGSLI